MHIVQLLPPIEHYSPVSGGAIATVAMQHSRRLMRRGHAVSVLSVQNGDELYPVGEVKELRGCSREQMGFLSRRVSAVKYKLNDWDWAYFERYVQAFTRALRQMSPPDVVIVHNDLVSPKILRRLLPEAAIIVWLHNENRTRRKDVQSIRDNVDMFVAVSGYIADWTKAAYQLPPEQMVVIPNGVDLELFQPAIDGCGEPSSALRVIFLGRIDRNKGPDIAADAVAALRAEGVAIELTVAGPVWFHGFPDPNADPFFRDVMKPKMLAAGGKYVGHVGRADVPDLLRSHDVCCVLSRSNEPFGLVALEAMACGCAVVSSNRGGLPQACGGAAVLVDPDDSDAVKNALRTFVTDSRQLAVARRGAVERAARADWSVAADGLVSVMEKLAQRCVPC